MTTEPLRKPQVIIIGDSFNNTLGLIRSIGEAGIRPVLILVGGDRLFVTKSRYLAEVYKLTSLKEVIPLLNNLAASFNGAFIICSNDHAAKLIDDNEPQLSTWFRTPMNGNKIGKLFEKNHQCELAQKCGIEIPQTIYYSKQYPLPEIASYPVLIKPDDSNYGEKSDIHICHNLEDLKKALDAPSKCTKFVIQQFIDKEYEINLIGIASERGIHIPGGIKKIRHYPTRQSPCSYGEYLPIKKLQIDTKPLYEFVKRTGYHGPFSIELLHSEGRNYFMEMNFRHDGLAYTATAAGMNLLDYYINNLEYPRGKVHRTYMMDLSIDYCHVKDGHISKIHWLKDFIRTGCQLYLNLKDMRPTISYYKHKIAHQQNKIKLNNC